MTAFFEVAEYNTSTGMIRLTSMTNYNRLNATFYPNPEDDYATLRGQLELIESGEGKIPAPSSPSNGDVLTYDSGTTTWVSAPPVREVFKCEYGVTAYADIAAALSAGKMVVAQYNDSIYTYGGTTQQAINFYAVTMTIARRISVATNTATWSNGMLALVPEDRTINNKNLRSNITLTASDVGALPNTTVLPTKTSDLVNDGATGTSVYVEPGDLAAVAISGSYNDLTNTPQIPGPALFQCEYNVTTYSEITQALAAGQLPYVQWGSEYYLLAYADAAGSDYRFVTSSLSSAQKVCVNTGDVWSVTYMDL